MRGGRPKGDGAAAIELEASICIGDGLGMMHASEVRALAYAPDGATVAATERRGDVTVWLTRGAKRVRRFEGLAKRAPGFNPIGRVGPIAFGPDGSCVAATLAGTLLLLDVHSQEVRRGASHGERSSTIEDLAFAPSGDVVASVGSDGALRFSDARGGGERSEPIDVGDLQRCLAFSPDGRQLVCGGDGQAVLIDVDEARVLRTVIDTKRRGSGVFEHIAFVAGGQLATWGGAHGVELWTASGEPAASPRASATLALQPTRDGETLMLLERGGLLLALDARTGAARWQHDLAEALPELDGALSSTVALAIAADGSQLCCARGERVVAVGSRGEPVAGSDDDRLAPAVALSADGALVASLTSGGSVRTHERDGAREIERFVVGRGVKQLLIAPDNTRLIVRKSVIISLYDLPGGSPSGHISLTASTWCALSPDGTQLAVGRDVVDEPQLLLYRLGGSTPTLERRWRDPLGTHEEYVHTSSEATMDVPNRVDWIAFAPDGASLVAGGDQWGGGVARFSVRSGKRQSGLDAPPHRSGSPRRAAFGASGELIAAHDRCSLSGDGGTTAWLRDDAVAVRQVRAGRELCCRTYGQRPRALALSADGATVAATLSDDSVSIWRLPADDGNDDDGDDA